MKKIFAVLCALLLVPTIPAVCCAESYQNIETLREQSPKEVVFDCKDQYGRNIYIDANVIIPEVECVPIVVVEKPKYEDCEIGRVCGQYADATEEDGAKRFMYSDNGFDYDIQIFTIGNTDVSILCDPSDSKGAFDNNEEIPSGKTLCSSDVEDDETIQKGMESITKNLQTLFSDFDLELGFSWVQIIENSRPRYTYTLRQKMEGIPILMGAGDPVVGVSEKTIGFKKPESWKRSKTFRWGDFFSCWNDMAYHDGGWNVRVAPLMEIEKKYDDVPLADINRVFEAIQNKIEEGNIRNIYAIRFGYCCYIGENDEDVLFPVWQIECDYYYNPKEKTKEYKEDAEAAPIARQMYRTMIVNAQTGEFMNPVELKEKLLDCPEIITWEDIQ